MTKEKKITLPPQLVAEADKHISFDASLKTIEAVRLYLMESGQFGDYKRLDLDYEDCY